MASRASSMEPPGAAADDGDLLAILDRSRRRARHRGQREHGRHQEGGQGHASQEVIAGHRSMTITATPAA